VQKAGLLTEDKQEAGLKTKKRQAKIATTQRQLETP
jgi:hypothetical protein